MHSIITGLGRSVNLRVWAFVACAGLLSAACDKLPLLAPQASTIKLSSTSTVVQTNGTTEIRATVLEPSGTPVQNGTTVTFTTNLGTVSPVDARTLNGVATVQFLGNGQSGKASVRAISGGAASDPLELSVGAAAAGRIVVTANPNQVAAGSPSLITATVTDANSNPLSGVLVSFSTDFGSLSSAISSTSSNGQAQAVLTTSRDATVTATVGTGTATTPATVKVTVSSLPDITITSSGTPTEGQPVTFTVAVTGTGSTESFQSIVVDFGDGTSSGILSGGNQSVSHTYARPGEYLVTATGSGPSGNTKRATTTVSVADRGIVDVRITRSPDTVTRGNPVTFTAAATGGGTVRSYSWNFGDGQSFNGSSQVSHTYSSTGPRTVTVTVSTTDGNTGRGQTQFVVQ
jgi:PKD repeat protein